MNRTDRRRDAERLLGGYAAGILTEEEKTLLFSAALEHQDLFDALADEEALRDLLADPAVRKRLLTLLAPAPKRVPWRRPAFLGLAAGLLAMVTTSVVLWRNKAFEGVPETRPSVQSAPAVQEPVRDRAEPLRSITPGKAPAPASPSPVILPSAAPEAAAPPAEVPARLAEPEPPRPAQKPKIPDALKEEKARSAEDPVTRTKAARREESRKDLADKGAPLGGAPPWRLDPLDGGRQHLTVASSRTVCVLVRTGTRVRVLSPMKSAPQPSGTMEWSFEFRPGVGDTVDLYLLASPAPDPAALPADGPVDGTRHRVWPVK